MKKIRMFGMAMLVVLMGVSFISCGNQDNEKKLVRIVADESDTLYTFKYDDTGKLIESRSLAQFVLSPAILTSELIWNDDVILAANHFTTIDPYTQGMELNDTTKYVLENNLIKYIEDFPLTYDESGRLVDFVYICSLIWDSDKLVEVEAEFGDESIEYVYSKKTCRKGYNPAVLMFGFGIILGDEVLHIAHPELYGMMTSQLIESITSSEGILTLEYEFDREGYISKIFCTSEDITQTLTFSWE